MKNNKGITLIALVVTILVLLILAGLSISTLTGENGILKQASKAKEETHIAQDKELIQLAINEYNVSKYSEPSKNLTDILQQQEWCSNALYKEKSKEILVTIKECEHQYSVAENGNITKVEENEIPESNTSLHPLLVDTAPFLWMRKQSATLQTGMNYSIQDSFNVSALANSDKISIQSGTGIERLSETDTMWAAVLMYDDGSCEPCIVTAVDIDNSIITIYPKNKKEIKNGKLEPLYSDSQHLSELGYKALMQYIYNINAKYCDRTVAYDRYAPTSSNEMKNTPYSKLIGTPDIYNSPRGDWGEWSMSQSKYGTFIIPYIDYNVEGQYGLQREIALEGREGFYETYIGTVYYSGVTNTSKIVKDSGYELHIEWYINDKKVSEILKTTNYVERFCFDIPKDASTAKIKVYYTKMRKGQDDTISIGDSTVWLSTGNYGNKLIRDGSSVVQMFDSWGAFWNGQDEVEENGIFYKQGASGKEMQRLLGANATYFNRSISGMTSRYGKAWFNKTVVDKHPNYVLLNYGINDENLANGAILEDVVGPDGNIIDMSETMTTNEFADNMYTMFKSAEDNKINPIYICSSIAVLPEWTTTFISNLANFYNQNEI